MARPHDAIQGIVPAWPACTDVDDYPEAQTIPGLVVYRYDAPLCFANAEDFRRRALAAADRPPGPLRWFVLNVEANVEVDFTALEAMETLREDIIGRGATFALARVKQDLLARLQAFGLAWKIGPGKPLVPDPAHGRAGLPGQDERPRRRQSRPMTASDPADPG